MRLRVLLMLVCAWPGVLRAESNIGLVTIVDGEVFVTRGSVRFVLAEGVRIEPTTSSSRRRRPSWHASSSAMGSSSTSGLRPVC